MFCSDPISQDSFPTLDTSNIFKILTESLTDKELFE